MIERTVAKLGVLVAALVIVGCSSSGPTTRPATIRERQDEALRDPFGYNNQDMPTVTGSGSKNNEALKRDINRVLNP